MQHKPISTPRLLRVASVLVPVIFVSVGCDGLGTARPEALSLPPRERALTLSAPAETAAQPVAAADRSRSGVSSSSTSSPVVSSTVVSTVVSSSAPQAGSTNPVGDELRRQAREARFRRLAMSLAVGEGHPSFRATAGHVSNVGWSGLSLPAAPAAFAAVGEPAEMKPAEMKPAEMKPAEMKPAEMKPAEMGTTAPRSGDAPPPDMMAPDGMAAPGMGMGTDAPPAEAPAAPTEKRLLMWGLGKTPVGKPLEDLGINFYGHVSQTYTFNVGSPSDRTNFGQLYTDRSNDYRFNQLFHVMERALPGGTGQADNPRDLLLNNIGAKYTGIFGTDSRFNHARGLLDKETGLFQYDPLEFYGDIRLPIGNGITTRVGKFVTYVGYEVIDATGNDFVSRSYSFNFHPFTHTGVVVSYPLIFDKESNSAVLTLRGGPLLGWDTFRYDNPGITGFFGVNYAPSPLLNLSVNYLTGPEKEGDGADKRNLVNVVIVSQINDRLKLGADIYFGTEQDGRASGGNGEAFWNTLVLYAHYGLLADNPGVLKAAGRFEWFNDLDGNRLGVGGHFFAFTAGLPWQPVLHREDNIYLAPIQIIPEIRYDFFGGGARDSVASGNDPNSPFQAGSLRHQLTLAVAVNVKF